ncbi:hypothetical protein BASA60_003133 [Batrachochytrium salamandrivorans]|nr:hypothetical protein BASA60_003133 [Batrachochytrium salamandrivorans]KAH9267988.1 hypothetical protein BASA84_000454 [Batrachochytrium salamandrivorans]
MASLEDPPVVHSNADVVDEDTVAIFANAKKKKKSKTKTKTAVAAVVLDDAPPSSDANAHADLDTPADHLQTPVNLPVPDEDPDVVHETTEPAPIEDEEDMFSGLEKKKKKKKKAVVTEDVEATDASLLVESTVDASADTAPVAASTSIDNPNAMFSDLKKKKKVTIESQDGTHPEPDSLDATFGEKKKKKKKSDMAAFEALLNDGKNGEEGDVTFGALGADADGEAGSGNAGNGSKLGQEAWLSSNRDYTYSELLNRVFNIIRLNNPERAQGGSVKYNIVAPQILKEGSKKTLFANLVDFCRRMRRAPDHLVQFLFAELGTSGSIDGNQRLIIKGKFQQKQIENVLKRYIVEYVTCKTCKSAETVLTKENRLFFLQCESCGSSRSVSAIKTGFVAQTTKRSAQRAAAGQ